MPFIIAGFLYVLLTGLALAVVGVICLVQGRPLGGFTRGGAVGSLAGFLLGCFVGGLTCIAGTAIGVRVGATAVIVVASLSSALLGMAVGAAASRRIA